MLFTRTADNSSALTYVAVRRSPSPPCAATGEARVESCGLMNVPP
jgi:hypothetical protein